MSNRFSVSSALVPVASVEAAAGPWKMSTDLAKSFQKLAGKACGVLTGAHREPQRSRHAP